MNNSSILDMNEENQKVYLNLTEALLNCAIGEELTILKANQKLIGARLVQTMLDYSINNYTDASERLIKIVVDLLLVLKDPNFGTQEFSKAIEYYEQTLTICKQRSYQQIQIMLLYYIRFFYSYTENYTKAIESGKQLLVLAEDFQFLKPEDFQFLKAETLLHLGNDYRNSGNLDEARKCYDQSLAITDQTNTDAFKKLKVDILNDLGCSHNYPYSWELATAIDICTKSLRIAKDIGYRHGEAIALTCIGKAHYWAPGEWRNFPEAINCYEQAKAIFEETENLQGELDALEHLQDSYNYTSQYAKAIEYNERLLSIAMKDLNNRLLEAKALFNLGRSYDSLGYLKKEKARDYYEQSLNIAKQIDHPDAHLLKAGSLKGLGGFHTVNGNLADAKQCYEESLKIAEQIGKEQVQANALQALADIHYFQGKLNEAWDYNERSLKLKEKLGDQIGRGSSIDFRGSIYLLIGKYIEALNSFEESLQVSEELNNVSGKAKTLTDIGITYLYLDKIKEAESKLQDGIKLWESVRGNLGNHDDFKLSIFEQQLRTYKLLLAVLIDQEKPLKALEIAERSRARALVDLLSSKLNGQTTMPSPTIKEIRQIAQQHNATLVEYLVDSSELYMWVIKPSGEIIFKRSNLKSLNTPLTELVINSRQSIGVRGRAGIDVVLEPGTDEKQRLQQLYNLLIQPITAHLPVDPDAHVIFIPHQELFLVPFPALQDEQGKYLIEKHTILTAPSIQLLKLTHQKLEALKNRNLKESSDILIVGNPVMPEVTVKIGEPAEKLSPLPGAEQEALKIAHLFNAKAFIGAEATEITIKSKLSHANIIHLATHGLLDYGQLQGQVQPDVPGALAFTPDNLEDGLLTSQEIFDLELNASLVVLSACDTGRGDLTSDGVIGLSRSFISAGTPSIIVSLWAVGDGSTANLMEEFYVQLKKNPNKARALRQAMLKTMEHHPHPKDWAAFTLIGETEGTILN
jgi:CHAT domain-containing protein